MSTRRVLAVCLDGYEDSIATALMDAGKLPALAALREASARFDLHFGPAERTGLAGEHFSTGLSPDAAGRWATVNFNKDTYEAWQAGSAMPPFMAGLGVRTVVFDPTYFNLELAPAVRGLVNWGAHDPGVPAQARPAGLLAEISERFGAYPASSWLYKFAWPSEKRCLEMGQRLAEGVRARADTAIWLLKDRLPDWDLGIVVTGELHSAAEALWFGIDPLHPLHGTRASAAAAESMLLIYDAIDEFAGRLQASFPDTTLVFFTMGGMGPNRSDVPSMVLLPELMYRRAFGRSRLETPSAWQADESGCPGLPEDEHWGKALLQALPAHGAGIGKEGKKFRSSIPAMKRDDLRLPLTWMPATRYQPDWAEMDAFALPSFYDGRIRVNLAGRERDGRVAPADYEAKISEIEELVRACIDPRTGESAVDYVERLPAGAVDAATAADLTIAWRGTAQALVHPTLGKIGPVPFNRVGGHTGAHGIAYLHAAGLDAGYYGSASSFDVVPTILALLGEPQPARLSGSSLLLGASLAVARA